MEIELPADCLCCGGGGRKRGKRKELLLQGRLPQHRKEPQESSGEGLGREYY
jgi:hypothetical protein